MWIFHCTIYYNNDYCFNLVFTIVTFRIVSLFFLVLVFFFPGDNNLFVLRIFCFTRLFIGVDCIDVSQSLRIYKHENVCNCLLTTSIWDVALYQKNHKITISFQYRGWCSSSRIHNGSVTSSTQFCQTHHIVSSSYKHLKSNAMEFGFQKKKWKKNERERGKNPH